MRPDRVAPLMQRHRSPVGAVVLLFCVVGPASAVIVGCTRNKAIPPSPRAESSSDKSSAADIRAAIQVPRGQGAPLRSAESTGIRRLPAHAPDSEKEFRSEPSDPGWSHGAVAMLNTALRADGMNVATSSVECRSRTCRVELKQADPTNSTLLRLQQRLSTEFSTSLANHTVDSDGRPETIIYLARRSRAGKALN